MAKSKDRFMGYAKYFRKKRLERGLTQSIIADFLGVNTQLVSNWERGMCRPPEQHLPKLMRLLKIPKQELMEFILAEQEKELKLFLGKQNIKNKRG